MLTAGKITHDAVRSIYRFRQAGTEPVRMDRPRWNGYDLYCMQHYPYSIQTKGDPMHPAVVMMARTWLNLEPSFSDVVVGEMVLSRMKTILSGHSSRHLGRGEGEVTIDSKDGEFRVGWTWKRRDPYRKLYSAHYKFEEKFFESMIPTSSHAQFFENILLNFEYEIIGYSASRKYMSSQIDKILRVAKREIDELRAMTETTDVRKMPLIRQKVGDVWEAISHSMIDYPHD